MDINNILKILTNKPFNYTTNKKLIRNCLKSLMHNVADNNETNIISSAIKNKKELQNNLQKIIKIIKTYEIYFDKYENSIKITKKSFKHRIYSYENKKDREYIEILKIVGAMRTYSWCAQKHVLYMILIDLRPTIDIPIIKFGYSNQISTRLNELKTEYGEINLIAVKEIYGQAQEKKFHQMLKAKYPNLVFKYEKDKKKKTELYKLNNILIEEFGDYLRDEYELDDEIYNEYDTQYDIEYINKKIELEKLHDKTNTNKFKNKMKLIEANKNAKLEILNKKIELKN